MKQVLYLSYDGMTDPLGQSQVLPYLIGLSKKGVQFTLVSFEKKDRFEKEEAVIRALCKENNIDWNPQFYTKKPPVLSTIKDVLKMKKCAFELHKKKPFSLVHCRSYISALTGLSLKKKFNLPFLFDMRGFWADERVDGEIWKLNNPLFKQIYRYFKRKERRFISESDAIISLTESGKEEILRWKLSKCTSDKIRVIPCCVDTEKFNPKHIDTAKRDQLQEELDLINNQVLGYIGSIGTWYMLPEMLQTFKRMHTANSNLRFLFVTRENPDTIWSEAKKQGVSHELLRIASVVHREVPLYCSLFDSSIFFIKPSYSKKASSPTKQGELMSMGIPIICNSGVGDTDWLIKKYHAGILLDDTEIHSSEPLVIDFSSFSKEQAIFGASDYFGLERGIALYWETYQKLHD